MFRGGLSVRIEIKYIFDRNLDLALQSSLQKEIVSASTLKILVVHSTEHGIFIDVTESIDNGKFVVDHRRRGNTAEFDLTHLEPLSVKFSETLCFEAFTYPRMAVLRKPSSFTVVFIPHNGVYVVNRPEVLASPFEIA